MNILDQILRTPKPADLALWWKEQPPATTAIALDPDESDYLQFFTSDSVEPVFRIGQGIANQPRFRSAGRKGRGSGAVRAPRCA
jgi:hypothetical protein